MTLSEVALDPGSLVRLDAALIARIRSGERLLPIVVGSLATIGLGAGSYGFAFGLWRGEEQALYAAIKLPLVLVAMAACTLGANALLSTLFKSRLGFRQSLVCMLMSIAIMSAILGALAPISVYLVTQSPPPSPAAIGRALDDPIVVPTARVARSLLLWHVAVVACAGLIGVVRLSGLLSRLIDDPAVARRVLWSWLAVDALVGSELATIFRPFLGKPHVAVAFFESESLRGNFVQEIGGVLFHLIGPLGPWLGICALAAVIAWAIAALRTRPRLAAATIDENGMLLRLDGSMRELVRWENIRSVRARGRNVLLESASLDDALDRAEWVIACPDRHRADALVRRIDRERARVSQGPFRTAPRD